MNEIEDLIYTSLDWRKNYIETGDPSLSAKVAIATNQAHKIKELSTYQRELCIKLESLKKSLIRSVSSSLGQGQYK